MHLASLPSLLVTFDEAAQLLGISADTIRHWHAGDECPPEGFPPPVPLGGRMRRWRRADLEAFVAALPAAPSAIPPLPERAAPAAAVTVPTEEPAAPRRGRGRPRKLGGAK